MPTIALDFETHYTGTYSVREMGNRSYVEDPRFKCLMAGAYSREFKHASTPDKFPWHMLHGATIVAHNAPFDRAVFVRLKFLGQIPQDIAPAGWRCSASACAYCGIARDLRSASAALFGEEIDKGVRDRLGEQQDMFDDVSAYCLRDAELSFRIWERLELHIPAQERELVAATDEMGDRGVMLDAEHLEKFAASLEKGIAAAKHAVPFRPVASKKAFDEACRLAGIEPPKSVARGTSGLPDRVAGWVASIQQWRSLNRTLRVVEAMRGRVNPATGRMPYQLKYFGAVPTGRWTGSGGLNVQNFNRDEIAGASLRGSIVPPPGRSLIVADYAQIEARVLVWLANDTEFLARLESGMDLYEAGARQMLGYSDPEPIKTKNPALRQLAKAMVLGLGFGMGAKKFMESAGSLGGVSLSFPEAQRAVKKFRDANPGIVGLWEKSEKGFRDRAGNTFYAITLPSGRRIRYWNPRVDGDGRYRASRALGEPETELTGPLIVENIVQGTARDLLAEAWLRCRTAGFPPVLSVHDELVFEGVSADSGTLTRLMSEVPQWARGLPVKVETQIMERYGK